MEITKKLEAEIKQLMDDYWDSYITGNLERWANYLVEDYRNIGGTKEEIWNNKKEILDYTYAIIDQMVGLAEIKDKKTEIIPYDPYIMVHEFFNLNIKVEGDWTFYGHFRLSSLIQKTNSGWKVLHQHGSYPDPKTQEGEAFAFDVIKAENAKLREAVKQRTLELEEKNRELEIETALEKVRSSSLAMKEPGDMVEVCRIISDQLQSLGVNEIRNVQTAIINEQKGAYLNYQYFTAYDKGIVEDTEYNKHPKIFEFVQEMKRSENSTFNGSFEGEELNRFREYRKQDNQFPDPLLDEAASMHYYFYSIGFGGLGLSTYKPLNDDALEIFKRFHNVFTLAYRRFIDIEKAMAQAREAQIELALERVRARAMAMQKSGELSELVDTVFKELTKLDFALNWCIINIIDEPSLSNTVWAANPDIDKAPESYHMKFEDYPFHHAMMKGYQERRIKHVYVLEGQEKKIYDEYLFNETEFRRIPAAAQTASRAMEKYVVTFTFSNFGGLQTVGETPLSDANLDILSRFGKVFDLTYTRFNDLKLAEAQAREAQIEAALERVRSRSMGMQKSEELKEVIRAVYEQFVNLKINVDHAGFVVDYRPKGDWHFWIADEQDIPSKITHPYFKSVWANQFDEAKENGADFFATNLNFEEKNKFYNELLSYVPGLPEASIDFYLSCPGLAATTVLMDNVGLYIENFSGIPYSDEENATLMRFGKVFQQTYTRFLDLQKAEAQAREAQVQLALERVRARSLAMHHTSELQEVVNILAQQLYNMNIDINGGVFIAVNNEVDYDIPLWASGGAADYMQKVTVPFLNKPVFISLRDAIKRKNNFFTEEHSQEEKIGLFEHLFKYSPWNSLSQQRKQELLSREGGYTRSVTISQHTSISITNHNGKKFSDDENEILKRFGNVFEQSYIRFLDLQKAEAQAREAEIQLALERVRARTMAMHHSTELGDVAAVLFTQMNLLVTNLWTCGFVLCEKDRNEDEWWLSMKDGFTRGFFLPNVGDYTHATLYKGWLNGDTILTVQLEGEALQEHYEWLMGIPISRKIFEEMDSAGLERPDWQKLHAAYFSKGYLCIITQVPCPEEEIFKRFAQVFDLTYTRFLDLQKAEAQAREAKIELALERVRARTMAMHKSDELPEISFLLFQQVRELGETAVQNSIAIVNEETGFVELSTTIHGSHLLHTLNVPMDDPHVMAKGVAAWKAKNKSLTLKFEGQELKGYNELRNSFQKTKINYPEDQWIVSLSFFSKGWLSFSTNKNVPDEIVAVQKRFASVFEQTYTRFLDLQKAEAQAREAQIELALERVRARTMGMQKSEELKEVIQIVYEQFVHLNINVEHSGFIMDYKARDDMHIWLADKHEVPTEITIPYFDSPHWNSFIEAKEKGLDFFANHLTFEEKNKFYRDLFKLIPGVPEETLEYYLTCPGLAISTVLLENVGLYIENFSGIPYSDEENATLMRFGKVFQQTYTRFLDLQKAEAQAREAQIEASLERVRSRSLAMHKTDELQEVVRVVAEELKNTGVILDTGGAVICTYFKDSKDVIHWTATEDPAHPSLPYLLPYFKDELFDEAWASKNRGDEYFATVFSYDVKNAFFNYAFEHSDYRQLPDEYKKIILESKSHGLAWAWSKNSAIMIPSIQGDLPSEEEKEILIRFAKVFEQSFIRFLDLQKAEAQAREAQIELALERVRARTMAMHKSEELLEVITVVSEQLKHLGFRFDHVSFAINNLMHDYRFWLSFADQPHPYSIFVPYLDNPIPEKVKQAQQKKLSFYADIIKPEDSKQWHKHVFENNNLDFVNEKLKQYIYKSGFARSIVLLPNIMLIVANYASKSYSEEENEVFSRFAAVFEQSYTRFLDLQKAEAQAREAQIQLSLERVRARTMAMQKSDELQEAAALLFMQVKSLGVPAFSCGFNIWEKGDKTFNAFMTGYENTIEPAISLPFNEDLNFKRFDESRRKDEDFYVLEMKGEAMQKHYQYLKRTVPVFKEAFDKIQRDGLTLPETQIHHIANFSHGNLMFITLEPCFEAHDIFKRFGKVFEQTYTRFLDLQKAEAQAREAQIEVALERVRSRSMAMHTSDEFVDASDVMVNQLKELGINTLRIGIGIINKEDGSVEIWSKSEIKGKVKNTILGFVPRGIHPIFDNMVDAWKEKKSLYSSERVGDEVKEYYEKLDPCLSYPKRTEFNERETMTAFFFKHGSLNVISLEPLKEEDCNIMIRFAKVFGQIYQRFLDLQKAEAQAREAKIEAALEKVRSRTMAMQKGDELQEVVVLLYKELIALGVTNFVTCGYVEIHENINRQYTWVTAPGGDTLGLFYLPLTGDATFDERYSAWKRQQVIFHQTVAEEVRSSHLEYAITTFNSKEAEEMVRSQFPDPTVFYCFNFSHGYLHLVTGSLLKEEEEFLLARFTKVFEQTYTRFLDLQKAEAQAREAQIETALERVRSRTMAMQKSDELAETVSVLFKQLLDLGVKSTQLRTCGIVTFKENEAKGEVWITDITGEIISDSFYAPYDEAPAYQMIYSKWKTGEKFLEINLKGNDFLEHLTYVKKYSAVPNINLDEIKKSYSEIFFHVLFFSQGYLFIISYEPLPDYHDIFKRFGALFQQTYTRFLDFKKVEAQNKIIQADNDRKTKELEDARELQLSMLPKELPKLPHLDIAVYMKTATEVGGDYYDFNVDKDGTLTFVVGDATGHGMMSGMMVSIMKSFFISHKTNIELKQFFENTNNSIKDMHLGRLMMAFMGVQITSTKIIATNAGMPSLIYFRNKSQKAGEFVSHNMPLGGMKGIKYSLKEINFEKGDTLLLMSDGFAELKNEIDEQYGYPRIIEDFKSVAQKRSNEIVDHLKNAASQWANGVEPDDDLTFVVIKVK